MGKRDGPATRRENQSSQKKMVIYLDLNVDLLGGGDYLDPENLANRNIGSVKGRPVSTFQRKGRVKSTHPAGALPYFRRMPDTVVLRTTQLNGHKPDSQNRFSRKMEFDCRILSTDFYANDFRKNDRPNNSKSMTFEWQNRSQMAKNKHNNQQLGMQWVHTSLAFAIPKPHTC